MSRVRKIENGIGERRMWRRIETRKLNRKDREWRMDINYRGREYI